MTKNKAKIGISSYDWKHEENSLIGGKAHPLSFGGSLDGEAI